MKASINGVEIAYDDVGLGPPVLLLHGFALSRKMWRPQMAVLAAAHRVIAPDFRGFGESRGTPSTLDGLASDVHALIGHLRPSQVRLGGFSMGGYVLFRYLARYAGDVKALMFLGTRAEADTAEGRERRFAAIRRIIVEGREGFLDDFLRQMVTSRTSESRPAVVAEVRRLLDSASAEVLTASLQAMADRPDSAPLLPTITLPTSIIVGQEDQVTPADSSRRMHAAIPGSTLVVIPEAGHMCNVEQPERFNAALLGFLGRIT